MSGNNIPRVYAFDQVSGPSLYYLIERDTDVPRPLGSLDGLPEGPYLNGPNGTSLHGRMLIEGEIGLLPEGVEIVNV